MGRTSGASPRKPVTGATQISKRMPASMALARLVGMTPTSRRNGAQSPATTISPAATIEAPIAAG